MGLFLWRHGLGRLVPIARASRRGDPLRRLSANRRLISQEEGDKGILGRLARPLEIQEGDEARLEEARSLLGVVRVWRVLRCVRAPHHVCGHQDALVQRDEEPRLSLEGQDDPEAKLGVGLKLQGHRLGQEPPISAPELSQKLQSPGPEGVRGRLEVPPERFHQLDLNAGHLLLQELRVQRVNPEFQRPQAHIHELVLALESDQNGVHQLAQVRQKVLQPDRQREAQLDNLLAVGPPRGTLEDHQDRVDRGLQHKEELLV
mmetsp:Transcript_9543/g.29045  ORF Transcript_9543/g.29045 Transcript_9543/m.29045 type:complete len:260 (-) Transcript_9543:1541-2320(-)